MSVQSDSSLYEEGMKAVTQSIPIVNSFLDPADASAFHEGVEDGKHIKSIIDSDIV